MPVTLELLIQGARSRARALWERRGALEREAAAAAPATPWLPIFSGPHLTVVAEVKRRSPSAGSIAPDLDPDGHAQAYVRGGARAISVLTDPVHFGGTVADLRAVAAAVAVPVLCKDFLLDPLQLVEARAGGASAVLLIVRALGPGELGALMREAAGWGLGTLVEVHHAHELEVALTAGARVVGVNARDLATFEMRHDEIESVLARVPQGVVGIAESGLATVHDVERVAACGADGILVGTSVSRAPSPEAAVRALAAVPRRGRARGVG